MLTFVVGKLVGLVAYRLLGQAFGTSMEMEAYLAANRFSETLFNLVAGGALASAFIPTLTTLLTHKDRESAWRLSSAIANLVLLVLITLGVLGAIFAPWVVTHLLALGFTDPNEQALTITLLRIQLPSAVIFGLSGLVMGILNAHQKFLFPALAPSMYPLGIIFGVLVLAPYYGIYGVAFAVVIGACLHLLIQIPQLLRLPALRYRLTLGWHLAPVREVLILMGPRLAGVAVVQLNFWVNTAVASLKEGSLSAITYSWVIMMMPEAAIAQSIAIASLPTFSEQVARNRPEEMRASLAATLRAVLLLALPAALGLIMLRVPIVALMYQGDEFNAQSTQLVSWALLWYSVGLPGHCVVEIISRAFYALHDTRTPVLVGVIAMTLNIGMSLLFWNLFERAGLPPFGGLALANSTATAIESAVLLALMHRRLKGLEGKTVVRTAFMAAAATAGMSAVLWAFLKMEMGHSNLMLTAGGVALGGLLYAVLMIALRVPEALMGVSWLRTKLAARIR